MKNDPTKFEQLRAVPLFSACSTAELRVIAVNTTLHRFSAGDVLIEEGASGHEFFVIIEGNARIHRRGRAGTSILPGGWVGELSLVDQGRSHATVVAETDLLVFVSSRREFAACLDASPTVAYRLLSHVVGRLRTVNETLDVISLTAAAC